MWISPSMIGPPSYRIGGTVSSGIAAHWRGLNCPPSHDWRVESSALLRFPYDHCPWARPAAMRASENARPATVWTLSLVTVRSPRVRARSSGATPTLLDGRIGPARRVGPPGFGRPGPEHKSAGRELP